MVPRLRSLRTVLVLALSGAIAASLEAGERFRYMEGHYEQGRLSYLEGLPVLEVAGTPAQMGRQEAMLTRAAAEKLVHYPSALFEQIAGSQRWPQLLKLGQALVPQFPADHLAELNALAAASKIDRNTLVGANTMTDTYRGGFGCSSLVIEPDRSATGRPLFGRNLDFFTLGWLQNYDLVTVYRPAGKHSLVSIGFPGMLGCLSGMNDAGLALATHEVYLAGDGSPLLNLHGMPYTLMLRRILEECRTIDEAEKLVRSVPRTTLQNVALCDREHACVLEITPKSVVRRDPEHGILACTNHFRTKPLRMFEPCSRYPKLTKTQELASVDLAEVAVKLNEVSAGAMTLETMIFEPAQLRLHLAIGSCPSSALPLKTLELAPLFRGKTEERGVLSAR